MSDEAQQIKELQAARARGAANGLNDKAEFGKGGSYDKDIYGAGSKRSDYVKELPMDITGGDDEEDDFDGQSGRKANPLDAFTAPQHLLNEFVNDDEDPLAGAASQRIIANRQSDYHNRRFERDAGPEKSKDAFSGEGGDEGEGSYQQAMRQAELEREEARVKRILEQRQKDGFDGQDLAGDESSEKPKEDDGGSTPKMKRKRRWDVGAPEDEAASSTQTETATAEPPKKRRSRWDETPSESASETGTEASTAATSLPDATPVKRSRWDQVPTEAPQSASGSAPLLMMDPRNRFMTDEELDSMLPSEGYKIVPPPPDYAPARAHLSQLMATPAQSEGFMMQDENAARAALADMAPELPTDIPGVGQLAFFKKEDQTFFKKILSEEDEGELTIDELKERKIMRLLLKIKNGTPPMRKTALRQITDRAREFGAGPLFDKILPLLMERTLEDQERHLLVKVIDRILYKLDDLVRPYVHRILVVIEPLLIDEDYYARVEGREIISNLSKAAGLAHMISTMRPDIDHVDEYVRNTTARAFSVVASALGIPALLPFLRAVCRSKKSWQARHTGIRIVQQIAIMMGCAILPHLKNLVDCVEPGLADEQQKVKTMTALALSALAEAAAPYGIECFENVLKPLWEGIRQHRGKGLAAFLKAIGFIIPLMDSDNTLFFVKEVTPTLLREFQSADEEMKKIVLKVVKQCAATDGVTGVYLKDDMLPEFFKAFWVRRMALDRRNYKQVVETTVELAQKTGVSEVVGRIVNELKDESEPLRKMVMETIQQVVSSLGAADIDERLEVQLIDGLIYAFQEQTVEDNVMLEGFGTVVNALGTRVKPYLQQIVSTILWRLNNKSAKTRQQAADLTTKLAVVIKQCDEDQLLSRLGVVLFEQLGEEFPESLASIISAEAAIANVVGMTQMNPPIKDLLPRMTPILRNRHEKVQEASINLIGRIADRGAEFVSAREWMRICFELLDLLKAQKKAIRRAAVNTFGYIAKAIGPQDVLQVLLTNLRVQERQSRVCSTVAIASESRQSKHRKLAPKLTPLSSSFSRCGDDRSFHDHSALAQRVPPARAQRPHWCAQGAVFRLRVHWRDGQGLRLQRHRRPRGRAHRPRPRASADGSCDRQAPCARRCWPRTRGLDAAPAQPGLAQHLRDQSARAEQRDGCHRVDARRARSRCAAQLHPARPLPVSQARLSFPCLHELTFSPFLSPARKVREVYVRIYNSNYLGAQDALVPFYPSMEDFSDEKNDYKRHDLYALL